MIPPEERRHLDAGPRSGEQPGGAGTVDAVAECRGDADVVLDRVRDVLGVVIDHQLADWPTVVEWRSLLPGWFVDRCAVEMSQEQAEEWLAWWRALSADQQAAASQEEGWALADWLFWLGPDERQWFWWHAEVETPDRVRLTIEVAGWPAPLGALEWLLRTAGCVAVTFDEDASACTR